MPTFEPMKNSAQLPEEVPAFRNQNVDAGSARLSALAEQIGLVS